MPEKNKNKYRIKSVRLENWDYGSNGMYFITICTKNRDHFFGEIIDGKIQLNAIGKLAFQYWDEIPELFPFITLGEFVVMPNHTHGILIIDKIDDNDSDGNNNHGGGGITGNKNPMFQQNISRIIRWYKGRCTFEIRKFHVGFAWQARFHDHIIRNEKSLYNISNYIINNPAKWCEDKFNNHR